MTKFEQGGIIAKMDWLKEAQDFLGEYPVGKLEEALAEKLLEVFERGYDIAVDSVSEWHRPYP